MNSENVFTNPAYRQEGLPWPHNCYKLKKRPKTFLCPGTELNRYLHCCKQDFKSCVSTNFTTGAEHFTCLTPEKIKI